MRQSTPRRVKAPWHMVTWITAITVIFSLSTMTLAAFAQSPSTGYTSNINGILLALRGLRREVRELSIRVLNIETRMVEKGLIPPIATNSNNFLAQNPVSSDPGTSRTGEPANQPATQAPAPTTPPPSEPVQPPPAPPAPQSRQRHPRDLKISKNTKYVFNNAARHSMHVSSKQTRDLWRSTDRMTHSARNIRTSNVLSFATIGTTVPWFQSPRFPRLSQKTRLV